MNLRNHQWMWALSIVLLLTVQHTAQAGEKLILITPPQLDSSVSMKTASSLADFIGASLVRSGARAATKQEMEDHMRQSGVSSLRSRADAQKVAKAMKAHALLRYQASMDGDKVDLRISVYLVGGGKAVMLERTVAPSELSSVVDKMIEDILGKPSEATAPGAGAAAGDAAPPPASPTPLPEPPEPSEPPEPPAIKSGPGIWASGPTHAQGGFVAGFHIGGSAPLGENSDDLEAGIRVGTNLGYLIQVATTQSLAPEMLISYTNWGLSGGYYSPDMVNISEFAGGLGMFNLMAGIRYSYYIGPIDIWGAGHFGLGHLNFTVQDKYDSSLKLEGSQTGFAMNVEVGAHFMIVRYIGAGLFLATTKAFVDTITLDEYNDVYRDYGAMGFAVGLNIKGKVPL